MRKIFSIARKELNILFHTPMATIVLMATIVVLNIFFFVIIDENREASLRDVFAVMEFMFVFITPLLTMKMVAEEKLTGTLEFLMTTPTSNTAIILGKYLGILIFYTLIILLTSVYYFMIDHFAHPDRLEMLVGYLGIWLEGAFFVALGILTSSLTRHQVAAAISSYAILFLLYFSTTCLKYTSGITTSIVERLSTLKHAENFFVGLITTADLIYYLSGIIFCLVLAKLSLDRVRE